MRKSLCAAVLSLGLLTEIAMPIIAATSKNRTSSKNNNRAVEGVGGQEMWVLVRRVAPQQAPLSGGSGAGAGAVIGGTAEARWTRRPRWG
jgi:hypothetical protein